MSEIFALTERSICPMCGVMIVVALALDPTQQIVSHTYIACLCSHAWLILGRKSRGGIEGPRSLNDVVVDAPDNFADHSSGSNRFGCGRNRPHSERGHTCQNANIHSPCLLVPSTPRPCTSLLQHPYMRYRPQVCQFDSERNNPSPWIAGPDQG